MAFSFDINDFESAKKTFHIDVPEQFNFGFDVIDKHAEEGDKRALVWTGPAGNDVKEYTFRDISRLSNQAEGRVWRTENIVLGSGNDRLLQAGKCR